MNATEPPAFEVSRPALSMIDAIGYGKPSVPFETFQGTADRPRSTVTRYLKQLTESWLILRVRQGEYAIPDRSTLARSLLDPSPYRRSVSLYADLLKARDEGPWALACLPIRAAFPMEIDRAIPVLPPDDRLQDAGRSPPYAEVLWYAFEPEAVDRMALTGDDGAGDPGEEVPVLRPRTSLALLTASLDPRFMQAARSAADRSGFVFEEIVQEAKHLSPQTPPLKALRPNTVVFPGWLRSFWETAKTQHARHALDGLLPGPAHGSRGARVSSDA